MMSYKASGIEEEMQLNISILLKVTKHIFAVIGFQICIILGNII